jgi:DNA-binding winged helix-turn-helix (wHTH) protein
LSESLLATTRFENERPRPVLQAGNLRLNRETFSVVIDDRETNLTHQEFHLLSLLLSRPDRVISHEELCMSLWGAAGRKESKRLAVVVSHLREKLYGAWPYAIESVRCRGYGLTQQQTIDLAKSGRGMMPPHKQGARRFLRYSSGLRRAWQQCSTRRELLRPSASVRGLTI